MALLDSRFAAFCRSGDPAALADVFDETAPELLRVARHLHTDPHAVEDLVQGTFLAAIESRERYDPEQPVLPWLLGILANRARQLHRQTHRAPRQAVHPLDSAPATDGGPESAAEQQEFTAAYDTALLELGEVHRQVLVLHLQHGLTAKEIGHALGRPAGTVRSQIARAMEHLRRVLPASFAAGMAAVQLPSDLLDRIRNRVLDAARDLGPIGGAGPPAASMLPVKAIVSILVLGAALTLGWSTLAGDANAPDPPPAATTVGTLDPAANRSDAEPPNAPTPTTTAARTATGTEDDAVAATTDSGVGTVRLRVRLSDGTPAADVGLRLVGPGLEQRTDDTGTVTFANVPTGPTKLAIDRFPMLRDLVVEATTDETIELSGHSLEGSVTDADGQPIAGAEVLAYSVFDRVVRRLGTTDRWGRFAVRDVVFGFYYRARADGYVPSKPSRGPATTDGPRRVELVLGPPAARVSGTVLDADGRPLPHALLALVHPDERPAIAHHVTADANGRFATRAAPSGSIDVLVVGTRNDASAAATPVRGRATWELVAGRDHEHDVRLAPAARIEARVVDAGDRPQAGMPVRVSWSERELVWVDPRLGPRTLTTDDDGRFVLDAVVPGRTTLVAAAGGQRTTLDVDVAAGTVVRPTIRLAAGVDQRIVVVDGEGEPREGFVVEVGPGAEPGRFRGNTAADGSVVAERLPRGVKTWVAVRPQVSYMPVQFREVEPSETPLEFVVRDDELPSCVIRGRIVLDGQPVARQVKVILHRRGFPWGWRLTTQADGSFSTIALPPGTYELEIPAADDWAAARVDARTLEPSVDWDVGTVDLGR